MKIRPDRLSSSPKLTNLEKIRDNDFRFSTMSTEQIIADAMALPLAERVTVAQTLWESIDAELPDTDERAAIAEAVRRSEELSSGKVKGETHEEVMDAVRQALECD